LPPAAAHGIFFFPGSELFWPIREPAQIYSLEGCEGVGEEDCHSRVTAPLC
jgi:hypothetical protein